MKSVCDLRVILDRYARQHTLNGAGLTRRGKYDYPI
jgi:hypothetical protein